MTALERLLDARRRHPSRPAIERPDGGVIDYDELVGRAAALAAELAGRGVRPGDRVLLRAVPDARWAIGVWGIWMARGVVAPVDARDAPGRLAELESAIAPAASVGDIPTERAPIPDLLPTLDDPAWLIHSSGSTGRPKGVRVLHRGVPALLDAQVSAFALHPRARVLAVLSPAFDASLSDLMTAHTSGACLVVDPRGLQDPAGLLAALAERRVTHVDLPPSVVAHIDPLRLPETLETVIMGGEVCPADAARAWGRRVRLVSVYGPTEATICTSLRRVADDWVEGDLGEPLPGVAYAVADGELLIAGDCLAAGYTDPAATARRFVDGWFRTGDRVREEGGRLIFAGRLDRMAKLQGRLAHPEEVERVLGGLPGVRRAVAWVEGGRMRAAVEGDATGARDALADALPRWMVPTEVVAVDRLPLTATGKVDLGAVPALEPPDHVVAALWSDALGRSVGPGDDLDDAGRDSFAVLQVLAGAEGAGLRASPEIVASAPTAAAMAARLGEGPVALADLVARLPEISRVRPPTPARRVLVTGATGALGSLVVPALRSRGVDVLGLSRRGGKGGLVGDVRAPELGVAGAALDGVDTVLHLAADLDALAGADALWDTNVGGTARVLALAAARGLAVHHASTLAVFACSDRPRGRVPVSATPSGSLRGGYPQTKAAAEVLAARTGAVVHRLGHLVRADLDGLLHRTARGLAADLPEDPADVRCNLTSIVAAADALAGAVAAGAGDTTHLVGPSELSLPTLVAALRGRRPPASALDRALARRLLLAPRARHPANVFLSTGFDWAGSLPAVDVHAFTRALVAALEAK